MATFTLVGGVLRCPQRHSFDLARQGYVSLLHGASGTLRADTAAMIDARDRVHGAEVFAPLINTLTDRTTPVITAAASGHPVLVDAGAGAGHYLRAVTQAATAADPTRQPRPLGIDLSKAGARAMLRGRPSISAVIGDVWQGLPVADHSATVVLSVFAPRNVADFARVLAADGALFVVHPRADHLGEIVSAMGMLAVGDAKSARVHDSVGEHFDIVDEYALTYRRALDARTVADLAGMGPSAFHLAADEIADTARSLVGDSTIDVTVSVTLTVCRPRR
ncbi:methyltransferase type 11 [Gordonia sp. ABSL1-1]|nr:methyltransferase type 11 [Gordonia sp. ABSL1-1]MDL9935662.1 methyltransferase type 11 [Gordonia sp. ABSL1-1]